MKAPSLIFLGSLLLLSPVPGRAHWPAPAPPAAGGSGGGVTPASVNGVRYGAGSATADTAATPLQLRTGAGLGSGTITDGDLLIGQTSSGTYLRAKLLPSGGMTVTNGSGTITLAAPTVANTGNLLTGGASGAADSGIAPGNLALLSASNVFSATAVQAFGGLSLREVNSGFTPTRRYAILNYNGALIWQEQDASGAYLAQILQVSGGQVNYDRPVNAPGLIGTTGTFYGNVTIGGNLGVTGATSVPQLTVSGATLTAAGTTGARTINAAAGSVRVAAGGASVVVTSSSCTAASRVYAAVSTADSTAYVRNVVPSAGSFTITLGAAATAETEIRWDILK